MFEPILAIDRLITSSLYSLLPHNSFFDSFFSFFSLRGLTIFVWIFLFFVFWYRERHDKTHHHFFWAFVASFGTTTILVNFILKNIFLRVRPSILFEIAQTGCPTDFSFPSGHASSAFAGAVIFAFYDKKRRYLYYGIASLVSLSRVYLGCHFVGDIIFGAILGYFIGKVSLKLLSNRKVL